MTYLLSALLLIGSFLQPAYAHLSPLKNLKPVKVVVNTNFCRCKINDKSIGLIRVDISQGKKFETQIRTYPSDSYTLAQCEAAIQSHPSCQ